MSCNEKSIPTTTSKQIPAVIRFGKLTEDTRLTLPCLHVRVGVARVESEAAFLSLSAFLVKGFGF